MSFPWTASATLPFVRVAAKLFRADVHTAATTSSENSCGVACSPVAATHHDERLVPIRTLMALMGYAVGNYAAFGATWRRTLLSLS